jgi:hypothetical protein
LRKRVRPEMERPWFVERGAGSMVIMAGPAL